MKWHPLLMVAATRAAPQRPGRPKQAPPGTPWEDLRGMLGSPDLLNLPTVPDWKEECLDPMLFNGTLPDPSFHLYGYDMSYRPAGVCMVHMSCAYPGCKSPFHPVGTCANPAEECCRANSCLEPPFDSSDLFEDDIELPAAVLHPKTAADVVRGVEFAREHDVGVSVKVAGHSYFGASAARGTLLIKMSTNYPAYAVEGSLTECAGAAADAGTAGGAACALATARGKGAYLRVGGGELFDTAYHAVFKDWNEDPAHANKYHFVGGYCGDVSAAGGWLQSGGLSGASMRLHGIGIDQVLHAEMVLPSGAHVRFGPSEWAAEEGREYPATTAVAGYCNARPREPDEALWEWGACEGGDVDFEELWFAVRGGGGGTFGIVTSLYYQLHDLPGKVQIVVANDPDQFRLDLVKTAAVIEDYLRFSLRYLFLPETLGNVTQLQSRSCNSPGIFYNMPSNSRLYCHNSAGDTIVEAWTEYLKTGKLSEKYGDDEDFMTSMRSLFVIKEEFPSTGYVNNLDHGPYAGRLSDDGGVIFLSAMGNGMDHVPMYTVETYFEDLVSYLLEEIFTYFYFDGYYLMGGAVPLSSDKMDSLGPWRRGAAFMRSSNAPSREFAFEGNAVMYEKFYELVWRDTDIADAENFPGILCHNHAGNEAMGPLKTDRTKPCPSILQATQEEREEQCISQAESFWGTVNVARLESIKQKLDPNSLFICNAGIGASSPLTVGNDATLSPTLNPTVEPTDTPTLNPTMEPTDTPTLNPTVEPTDTPTLNPTLEPTSPPTPDQCLVIDDLACAARGDTCHGLGGYCKVDCVDTLSHRCLDDLCRPAPTSGKGKKAKSAKSAKKSSTASCSCFVPLMCAD